MYWYRPLTHQPVTIMDQECKRLEGDLLSALISIQCFATIG